MGGFVDSFVSNPLGATMDVVNNPAQAANNLWNSGGRDAAKLAALAYGGYLAYPMIAGAGAAGAAGAGAAGAGAAGAAGAGAAGAGAGSGMGIGTALLASGGAQLLSGYLGSEAARSAASSQSEAAAAGIGEQRRQFDEIRRLLQPYVDVGQPALAQQQALIGMGGADAQQQAISALEQSPQFQSSVQQGENALLQNASATGGLRGGNLQGALAQFRPQMLSGLIEQQYNRLGGLAGLGQRSAVGVGGAGQEMAGNVSNLFGAQGAAQAAGTLGQAQAFGNALGGIGNLYGQYAGYNAFQNMMRPRQTQQEPQAATGISTTTSNF